MKDIVKSYKSFITTVITVIISALLITANLGLTVLPSETITQLNTAVIGVFTMVFTFYFAKKQEDGGAEQQALMNQITNPTQPTMVDTVKPVKNEKKVSVKPIEQ